MSDKAAHPWPLGVTLTRLQDLHAMQDLAAFSGFAFLRGLGIVAGHIDIRSTSAAVTRLAIARILMTPCMSYDDAMQLFRPWAWAYPDGGYRTVVTVAFSHKMTSITDVITQREFWVVTPSQQFRLTDISNGPMVHLCRPCLDFPDVEYSGFWQILATILESYHAHEFGHPRYFWLRKRNGIEQVIKSRKVHCFELVDRQKEPPHRERLKVDQILAFLLFP